MSLDALLCSVMPAFAPPPEMSISEWAEEHRRLPVASAAQGARWRRSTAPYLSGILDAVKEPGIKRLAIEKGHQTGGTTAEDTIVGYFIAHDPCTILLVCPSFTAAEQRSKGSIADMIRSTPALSAVVRDRRAPRGEHRAESTTLQKIFGDHSLVLAGAGTPNSFAALSARVAIGDDVDRFPPLDEGDPLDLLSNRTTSFYDGITIYTSTPTLKDGPIDSLFARSDRRRYHLTCGCGHENYVTWSNEERFSVTYENRDPLTARLKCPGCSTLHDEAARRRMVGEGRWLATATTQERGLVGFHLPSLISTLGDVTLPTLVDHWLSARERGPEALRVFVNTVLGEGWEDKGHRIDPHALAARLEDLGETMTVPKDVLVLTAGVDVQIDRFEIQVLGWGLGGESWVVDAHTIPGDPSMPEVQAALLTALDQPFKTPRGPMPIATTCVDSGYLPEKVAYSMAARRPRRIFAIKGVGGRFGEPSILHYDPRKWPVTLNVDGLKTEVSQGLELAAAGPGYMHLNRLVCDEGYLSQLTAEHRETKRRNGVSALVWVEDRAENHALDTAVYARAALKLLTKISGSRTDEMLLLRIKAEKDQAAQRGELGASAKPRPPRTQNWQPPQ